MTTNAVVLEMFLSGSFTSVPLYAAAGTKITRGLDPYGTWPSPSRFECEINNDSLDYDPSRPAALLYGIAGRNTLSRIRVNGSTRLLGEASVYSPDKTIEHVSGAAKGRSWVGFTAEGISSRLGLWEEPLRSPMYRTNSLRSTNIGHWPLEDDSASARLANTAVAGLPGAFKGGATLGDSTRPDGAKSSAKVTDTSQLSGKFLTASTTAGWQVYFAFKMPALPPSATYGELFSWRTSNSVRWTVLVNNGSYQFNALASDGSLLWTSTVGFGTGAEPNKWVTMRIRCVQSGGNVDVQPAWYAQGMSSPYGVSDLFAGAVGGLRTWEQNGNTVLNGTWFGHIGGVTTVADSLVGVTAQQVFNGYRGEPAGTRFARIVLENSLAAYALGTLSDTQLMGPQPIDSLMSVFKDIRDTDDCRIDDERFTVPIGLTIRTRKHMISQAPALTLTYPGQVAVPFKKTIGNKGVWNRVTVKQRDGGESTTALVSGLMSTQPPPAGIGEIKKSIDVNVAVEASQLDDIGSWHLAKGTLDRPRYEQVTIDLLANPSLEGTASGVREGDMVRVTGYEADPIDLMVVGIEESIGNVEHTLTFKTEPYEPYQVGTYDDAGSRYDSRTSTMAAGATTTGVSFSLTCTDPNDVWSTTSLPYQLMVGGERVTATAMTAPAGTGPYTQTATVTRSVNGVVKAQVTGTEVHIADPKRWGL